MPFLICLTNPAAFGGSGGWEARGHGNSHGWPMFAQCARTTSPFLDVPPIRRLFVHLGKSSRNVAVLLPRCGVGQMWTRRAFRRVQFWVTYGVT